jgi:hypothetical protein
MDTPNLQEQWTFDEQARAWHCGTSTNGAGVFYEDGTFQGNPEGWYYGTVVFGDIYDIADGPHPDKETAQRLAEASLVRLRALYE